MPALWGAPLQKKKSPFGSSETNTQQLHFSVTLPRLHGTTPQLPLSIIDEASAVSLICHRGGRSRLWAASAVCSREAPQLIPVRETKKKTTPFTGVLTRRTAGGLQVCAGSDLNSVWWSCGKKVIISKPWGGEGTPGFKTCTVRPNYNNNNNNNKKGEEKPGTRTRSDVRGDEKLQGRLGSQAIAAL